MRQFGLWLLLKFDAYFIQISARKKEISRNHKLIIKEIKTSSGLYWVAQAFALLHVLRRQGEIYFILFI